MDITPYVDGLRRDLLAAAEAAGPETRAAAERLAFAIDPSARLALMEALSQAAAEITTEMREGGVDVRLNGRELDFVVEHPPAPQLVQQPAPQPSTAAAPEDGTDEGDDRVARITLRLPESVKVRAEDLAARSGHSLNTWLVNVVRLASRSAGDSAINVDLDLSSVPFLGADHPFGRRGDVQRRMNGWI